MYIIQKFNDKNSFAYNINITIIAKERYKQKHQTDHG